MKKLIILSSCLLSINGYTNSLFTLFAGIGGNGVKSNAILAEKVASSKLAQTHLSNMQAFVGDKIEVPRPGGGFDSRTGLAYTTMCLANDKDPNAIIYSDPQGVLNFTSSLSGEALASKLNANISGHADFGFFSASISADYVKENSSNSSRLIYNYMQAMTVDAAYTVPGFGTAKALNQDAQDALTYGKDIFTNYCGDSFVTSAKMGAMLIISANIEFAGKSDREAFEGSASGSIAGLGAISGAFKNEQRHSTMNAKMNISIVQQGGDVSKLASAFGEPGPSGYYVVSCSAGNIDACDNAISAVIHYAKTEFQTSIDLTDPAKRKNYYTWDTNQKTYQSIGVGVTFPELTPDGLAAKQYLVKQVQADREMLAYLKRYTQQPFYTDMVGNATKDRIKRAIKDYGYM